ncbi:hypothetical protein FOMG_19835 [Fusarium oxysporum f. sp. melonis 26406]|uniref:Uncharacterized protein n=1 Tax=Fusarium oxysporum f. sp. melonis 26406 TaxID=1089452 RepID=W9YW22_FUSOX|nr:hypothetical protein FOMG_19835 [Fusarium oxysporum f. sp. melonis 26406]
MQGRICCQRIREPFEPQARQYQSEREAEDHSSHCRTCIHRQESGRGKRMVITAAKYQPP